MPELPEVETVKRALSPHLKNRRISRIEFYTPSLRQELDQDLFTELFQGRVIQQISRRSKYLFFQIDGPKWILSHLGMTGSWRICPASEELKKHEHIAIGLDEGSEELRYCDPRRFGEFRPIAYPEEPDNPLPNLGPEPFWPEFNAEYLFKCSRKKTKPVKNFIMDPQVVCGIGNIYASESLFMAGISPLRQAGKLRRKDCEALVEAGRIILQRAINAGGTTIIDFQAPDGSEGWFHRQLQVYGRNGETCVRCGKTVEKIVQSGRSSFYCRGCQK